MCMKNGYGQLNYTSSNVDEDFELHEDSESDDKESRPSNSQTAIFSLLKWLKFPIPAENL